MLHARLTSMRLPSEFPHVVAATPLQPSDRLSALTGAHVYLKREDLTRVRSYKLRGAYNADGSARRRRARGRRGHRERRQPCAGCGIRVPRDGDHAAVSTFRHTPPSRSATVSARTVVTSSSCIVIGETYRRARPPRPPQTSRGPARPWSRRSTTRAPPPARAPSPREILEQLARRPRRADRAGRRRRLHRRHRDVPARAIAARRPSSVSSRPVRRR